MQTFEENELQSKDGSVPAGSKLKHHLNSSAS